MATKKIHRTIYLILDNIRSAHNVGSIFRTADGAGVNKIYVCGYSPQPSRGQAVTSAELQIAKTALGAEKTVPWEHHKQTWKLLKKLKMENGKLKILALEITPDAQNIFKLKSEFPLALVVGNEVKGIGKNVLKCADKIIEIPMHGKKESLNVSVAAGIALYQLKTL